MATGMRPPTSCDIFCTVVDNYGDIGVSWRLARQLANEHGVAVRLWLDRPPQTNEVGRATALMGGLLTLGERHDLPVRLLEIGSSGGLNLRADHYRYEDQHGTVFGDPASLVRLRWQGEPRRPWPGLRVVERLGSDVMPIDVAGTEGRLALTAYVWPDQTERLERLRGAFAVADRVPAEVRRQDAVSFVEGIELAEGRLTVLFHSVMWQYLPAADQAAVSARLEQLGAAASPDRPFAHLRLEPLRRTPGAEHEFLVALTSWPGDGERRVLGDAAPHGVPATWE